MTPVIQSNPVSELDPLTAFVAGKVARLGLSLVEDRPLRVMFQGESYEVSAQRLATVQIDCVTVKEAGLSGAGGCRSFYLLRTSHDHRHPRPGMAFLEGLAGLGVAVPVSAGPSTRMSYRAIPDAPIPVHFRLNVADQ